jgi:hypothetical protein
MVHLSILRSHLSSQSRELTTAIPQLCRCTGYAGSPATGHCEMVLQSSQCMPDCVGINFRDTGKAISGSMKDGACLVPSAS